MPNWASTTYTLTGKDARKVFDIIEKYSNNLNDHNRFWLGHVVEDLNNGKCDIYARGWVNDWDIESDESIILYCETAWSELSEWRHFVESKFEDLKIYYICSECGMEIYMYNNPDFESIYEVDTERNGIQEFDSEKDMLQYVCEYINKKEVGTRKEVEKSVEEFNEKADDDDYIYIHEYEYIDD